MAYYPSINKQSFRDYVCETLGINENAFSYNLYSSYRDDYMQFISESEPIDVTEMRYDYDESIYDVIKHSVSHVHFGKGQDIRVSFGKVITPVFFAKLVMEYYFFDRWSKQISGLSGTTFYLNRDFEEIDSEFFCKGDRSLPFITIEL